MDEIEQDIDLVNNEEVEEKAVEETVDWRKVAEEKIAEAKKYKAILERQKQKQQPQIIKKEVDDELVTRLSKLEQTESKRQFGYENSLSPEETDWIFQATGGKPTKESLDIPFIKHGLEGYRSSKRAEQNIPAPSSRSITFNGKDFKELSSEERQKAFEQTMKNVKK